MRISDWSSDVCSSDLQQVAARRAHQQRALADREAWLGADAEQAFGLRFDAVAMRVAQRLERGPLLPAAADVLALVLADRAAFGFSGAFAELGAAGGTDETGHAASSSITSETVTARARLQRGRAAPAQGISCSRASARTGKVPTPRNFGGTAQNAKPSSGSAARLHRCSTIRIPAPSRIECTGHDRPSVPSMLIASLPTSATPQSRR